MSWDDVALTGGPASQEEAADDAILGSAVAPPPEDVEAGVPFGSRADLPRGGLEREEDFDGGGLHSEANLVFLILLVLTMMVANLLLDLLSTWLDPRLRVPQG